MASYTIEIQEQYDLPKDKVFALFSDHKRLGGVLGAPIKRIKDSNQADPNGVGSVRRIGVGPLGLEETVIAFEQDALIEYTVTSVSPIRNHLGRIRFDDVAGKTVEPETVQGSTAKVVGKDGMVMIDGAHVVTADVETSNGVIHVIDKVIMPSM